MYRRHEISGTTKRRSHTTYLLKMWVMTKRIKGREYLYLYKTVWREGRAKSIFVKYLGLKERLDTNKIKEIIEKVEKEENETQNKKRER